MAGLSNAFRTGFNMVDTVERQKEDRRRYEDSQARLDAQDERQAKIDARQEKLFGLQRAKLEHDLERQPTIDKQNDELFKSQLETSKVNRQNILLGMQAKRKEMKQKDITDAWGIGWEEQQATGTISQETYEKMAAAGAGTPFDISDMTDPDYMKSVDNLNAVAKNGFGETDPDMLIGDFNKVFKNEINRFNVTDNAAYNRVTDADVDKDGNFTFQVTAYDGDGNPIKSVYTGDAVPYRKLLDGAFSRKAIIASVVASPEFKAQLDYAHKRYGSKTENSLTTSNVKYAQRLYRDILDDAEKNKREIRRSYQQLGAIGDSKKMQSELDQVDRDAGEKVAQLSKMFTPTEISAARLPINIAGNHGGDESPSGSGQSNADDDKRVRAMELLKSKGLLKE